MNQIAQQVNADIHSKHGSVGLKVAIKILKNWGCSNEQMQSILSVSRAALFKYKDAPQTARLTQDQIQRISYILNIHAALRVIFSNQDNVNNFMSLKNHNPYFEGATPLSLIDTGSFAALYEVFKRIDCMRGGSW